MFYNQRRRHSKISPAAFERRANEESWLTRRFSDGFLRRIPYKVLAKNPSLEQFSSIFQMVCRKHGVEYKPEVVDHLCHEYYEGRGLEMRSCHPRDLVEHMVHLCRYRKQTPVITPQLLDEACQTYFLDKPLNGTQAAV